MESKRKRVVVSDSSASQRCVIVNRANSFARVQERAAQAFGKTFKEFTYLYSSELQSVLVFDDESLSDAIAVTTDENVVLYASQDCAEAVRLQSYGTLSSSTSQPLQIEVEPEPVWQGSQQGLSESAFMENDGTVIPYCLHNQPCILLEAHTEANNGRHFFRCKNDEGPAEFFNTKCKAFKWKDEVDALPTPYCKCDLVARIRYVEKVSGSKYGIWFFICPKRIDSCGYRHQIP